MSEDPVTYKTSKSEFNVQMMLFEPWAALGESKLTSRTLQIYDLLPRFAFRKNRYFKEADLISTNISIRTLEGDALLEVELAPAIIRGKDKKCGGYLSPLRDLESIEEIEYGESKGGRRPIVGVRWILFPSSIFADEITVGNVEMQRKRLKSEGRPNLNYIAPDRKKADE